MQEAIDAYIASLEKSSMNTAMAYRTDLYQFSAYLLDQGGGGWSQITSEQTLIYLCNQSEQYAYRETTIARKFAAIRSFFRYLTNEALITGNPLDAVSPPPVPHKERVLQMMSHEQMEHLLKQIEETSLGIRDRAMLCLLHESGMRIAELMALNLESVNLQRADATVTSLLANRVRYWTLPLSSQSREALSIYLEQGRPHLVRNPAIQAFFLNHRGERLSRQGLWFIIKGYQVEENVPLTPRLIRQLPI